VFVTRSSEILDSAIQDKPYTDTLAAVDEDIGQTLTYSIITGPAGLAIGPTTGKITWRPSADTGTYAVTARVTDDSGAVLRYSVVNGAVRIDSVTGIVTWSVPDRVLWE
jgi:hypothetical protein